MAEFRLKTARDRVSTYQCGDYIGQHHFCAICGIGTYSEFPSFESGQADTDGIRVVVNVRLIEDTAWEGLPVKKINGREDWRPAANSSSRAGSGPGSRRPSGRARRRSPA